VLLDSLTLRTQQQGEDKLWMQLEAIGQVWIGLSRSTRRLMLSEDVITGGSKVAVIGEPVGQQITFRSLHGYVLSQVYSASDDTIVSSNITYSDVTGNTTLTVIREMRGEEWQGIVTPNAVSGWIFAHGTSATFDYHGLNNGFISLVLNPVCSNMVTCNGRGACPKHTSTTCRCDAGYAGDHCDQCAAGFTPNTGSSSLTNANDVCVPVVDLESRAVLTLAINASNGLDAPGANTAYLEDFVITVASILNISVSRVSVSSFGLQGDALLLQFEISPATNAQEVSAVAAAAVFSQLLGNTSSSLWQTSVAAVFLPQDVTVEIHSTAGFTVQLTPALTLAWSRDAVTKTIKAQLAFAASSSTWFAIGFNSKVAMLGTTAFAFEPATGTVSKYSINDKSQAGISSQGAMPGVLVSSQSGVITVAFQVRTTDVALLQQNEMQLVYAVGAAGETAVSRHALDSDHVGGGTLNVAAGTYIPSNLPIDPLRLAHGSLMFTAWNVLTPLGIAFPRYFKKCFTNPTTWFRVHRGLQSSAVLTALTAVGLAIASTPAGTHFSIPHTVLGLVVIILAIIQPVLGILRPHKADGSKGEVTTQARIYWEHTHRSLGYLLQILAIVSCFLGLIRIQASPSLTIAYAVWVAFLLLAFLLLEVRTRCCVKASNQIFTPVVATPADNNYTDGSSHRLSVISPPTSRAEFSPVVNSPLFKAANRV
jgi:hypothetical protein